MPSPFPGMDPYLEGSLWTTVHAELAVEIARQLAPRLRPHYLALPQRRFVLSMPEQVPQFSIEIRDTEQRRLVTDIEVLSPTNKRDDGRDEYLERRRRLLLSSAHLMEIDLLRGGERPPMRVPLPDAPYFVVLSRAPRRPVADVWPIRLEQALPTVPVPLLPGFDDVPLDLQQVLTSVYDTFAFDLAVNYGQPAPPALSPEEQAWAAERVPVWVERRRQ